MRPIPLKMREDLSKQKRMKQCAVFDGQFGECEGRIEFDHVWIYAGKQINELWAIVGLCSKHHRLKDGWPLLRNAIMRVSLALATAADLAKYPRKPWGQIKKAIGLYEKPS